MIDPSFSAVQRLASERDALAREAIAMKAAWMDMRAERDDYAARLKATDKSWTEVAAELDALRAENERAAATNRDLWVQLGHVRDLAEALKAENEQLRAVKDGPTHATPDT